jgi:hypothetical protein
MARINLPYGNNSLLQAYSGFAGIFSDRSSDGLKRGINCGDGGVSEIAKTSSLDRQLACFDSYVGRLYGLGGVLGGRWTNPKYPLTFVGGQVGVIFGGKF